MRIKFWSVRGIEGWCPVKIDNGNELFGNHTISNTTYGYTDKKATNGYEALKAYDLNGDNAIDEKDEIFNKLKIWKGTNSNGITDEGES